MAIQLASIPPVAVASSNVAVPLIATVLWCTSATLQAEATNVGNVYIGGSDVTSTNGAFVSAGESIEIAGDEINGRQEEFDLSRVYINASTIGNGVRIIIFKRAP